MPDILPPEAFEQEDGGGDEAACSSKTQTANQVHDAKEKELVEKLYQVRIITYAMHAISILSLTYSVSPRVFVLIHFCQMLLGTRSDLSKQHELPPIRIATNATLSDMASKRPTTMSDLRFIRDLSEIKALKFGPAFIKRIVGFCQENNLPIIASSASQEDGLAVGIALYLFPPLWF